MKSIFDKLKGTKNVLKSYREGLELLEAQSIEAKDFDDTFVIESKDIKWSFPIVARAIKKRQTKLIVYEPQGPEVFCGMQGDYVNREYCEKNGIAITPFPTQGGALVCDKGDLLLVFIHPARSGEFKFLDHVKSLILQSLPSSIPIEEITMPGNDILVQGKKLSGSTTTVRHGSIIESIFINGVNSQKHLEAVGHKAGKLREVISLTELGRNPEEFRTMLIELTVESYGLHNHYKKEKGKGKNRKG
ncbi:MAG: hypothetical protein FWH12_02490 [Treponema sp.]|nr:hypothetical protein [Treponema sp.]